MARTLYFVGGEDFDFNRYGTVSVDTDSSHRSPLFSRCALTPADGVSAIDTGDVTEGVSSCWFHARVWMPAQSIPADETQNSYAVDRMPVRIVDSNGVIRLAIIHKPSSNFSSYAITNPVFYRFATVNEAGTITPIGPVFSVIFSGAPSEPDGLDIFVSNYDVPDGGSVKVWINNTLAFSIENVTLATDANTTINGWRLAGMRYETFPPTTKVAISYSEVVVAAEDTRNLRVGTLVPSDDGNTDNWTTGGVANINETVVDDGTGNTSDTPGEIQQYVIDAPVTPNYGVVAVVLAARAQKGSLTGPENIDLGVRTSAADYWSADIPLPVTLQRLQAVFLTNPASGDGWIMSQISDPDFNLGMQSVA